MANHYHDPSDFERLKDMAKLAPEEFRAWVNFDSIVAREDGDIPRKYRELIAVAVAMSTQCPYCIEVHSKHAKQAGATKEELVEACLISAALCAGAPAVHTTMALKLYEQE